MNRSQLINAVTEELQTSNEEWTKTDVKEVLETFESVVTQVVATEGKVTLSGFLNIVLKSTPAKPERPGRNPATGETITLKAKPASVTVRVSPLKAFKEGVIAAAPKPKEKSSKKKKGKKKKK